MTSSDCVRFALLTAGHHVTLLPCQPSAIVDFVVQFAMRSLKEALTHHPDDDSIIGQLIILSQYGSQSEASGLLWQLFQTIQKKRSFVCTSLLQHVTSILNDISINVVCSVVHLYKYYTVVTEAACIKYS